MIFRRNQKKANNAEEVSSFEKHPHTLFFHMMGTIVPKLAIGT